MTAQVAADLRAAAEVLRRDGWCQRAWLDGGRRCVSGAITKAVMDRVPRQENFDVPFMAAFDALTIQIERAPMNWNDEHGRTAEEVIDALEAAANAAERGES